MAHVPAITHGGVVLTGPAAAGSAGQLLATDGAGGLHFVSPAGMEHGHSQSEVTNLVSDLAALQSHAGSTGNPHAVTKAQVGLGNVDNVQQQPLSSVLSTLASSATVFGLSLIDDANAAAARGTLVVPQAPAANGTAEASKALVPDGSLDLAGLRNLSLTGNAIVPYLQNPSNSGTRIKFGSGQSSTDICFWQNAGEAQIILRGNGSGILLGAGLGLRFYEGSGYVTLASLHAQLGPSGTSGLLEINNGTAGTLRDLTLRNLTLSGPLRTAVYTVGTLPTSGTAGRVAYSSNARKSGEGSGAGTGCPVWDDGVNWRTNYDNSVVAA